MTTVKVHAQIASDGSLRLHVPVGLPPGEAEVLVVVQPRASSGAPAAGARRARSGLFLGQAGKALDVDAALKEMNEAWRSKLSDLP